MERINTSTRQIDKWGPGKDGFTDGALVPFQESTQLNAAWHDQVQEEVANVIEAAGMDLDPNDREQLLKAIQFLVAAGMVEPPATQTAHMRRSMPGGGFEWFSGGVVTNPLVVRMATNPDIAVIHTGLGLGGGLWYGPDAFGFADAVHIGEVDANGIPTVSRIRFHRTGSVSIGQPLNLPVAQTLLAVENPDGTAAEFLSSILQAGNSVIVRAYRLDINFIGFRYQAADTALGAIYANGLGGVTYGSTVPTPLEQPAKLAGGTGTAIDRVPVYEIAASNAAVFDVHELQEAVPWAVRGDMAGLADLVPVLWAELQSVRRRLEALEGASGITLPSRRQ